jgi:hypothetical protein
MSVALPPHLGPHKFVAALEVLALALRSLARFAQRVLYAVLVLLEPIVTWLLCTLGMLGLLAAILWQGTPAAESNAHRAVLLGTALGCLIALGVYTALLAVLKPR